VAVTVTVAAAATTAVAVGLLGLWLLVDAPRVMPASVLVQVESEPAVSDTPFDDMTAQESRTAGYSPRAIPSIRETGAPPGTRFDARAAAKARKTIRTEAE
jgi:hypothetical protein